MKSSSVAMVFLSLFSRSGRRCLGALPRDPFAGRTTRNFADRPGRILRADALRSLEASEKLSNAPYFDFNVRAEDIGKY